MLGVLGVFSVHGLETFRYFFVCVASEGSEASLSYLFRETEGNDVE